ncbi:MAG TPA: hypothetical protein VGI79_03315 [Caulobacteraceae bacterium]
MNSEGEAASVQPPTGDARFRYWAAAAPLVLLLAMGAVAASQELVRQWLISRIEGAAASVDIVAAPTVLARLTTAEKACDAACGPRALAAGGAARALIAARLPNGPRRAELASKASAQLRAAIAEQPESGERWGWLAVSESARPGDEHHRAAIAALERSYRLAPFVRELAVWRARFAGSDWAQIDRISRERALDEVAHLTVIDPNQAQAAEDAFNGPTEALALDLRLSRSGAQVH